MFDMPWEDLDRFYIGEKVTLAKINRQDVENGEIIAVIGRPSETKDLIYEVKWSGGKTYEYRFKDLIRLNITSKDKENQPVKKEWEDQDKFYIGEKVELIKKSGLFTGEPGEITAIWERADGIKEWRYVVKWSSNKYITHKFEELKRFIPSTDEKGKEDTVNRFYIGDYVDLINVVDPSDPLFGAGKVIGINTTPINIEDYKYTVEWPTGNNEFEYTFKELRKADAPIKKATVNPQTELDELVDMEFGDLPYYGNAGVGKVFGCGNVIVTNQSTVWETEIEKVTECSKMPKEVEIFFSPLVLEKLRILNEKYHDIEWLVYFLGDKVKREITDLIIPKQRISTASVDDVELPSYTALQIVGVGHSHHGMNIGFSSKDWDNVNINHDISVLIHNTGKMEINCRITTPCGSIKDVKGVIRTIVDGSFSKEDFLKEADKNLSRYYVAVKSYIQGKTEATVINKEEDATMNKIDKRLRKFIRRGKKIHTYP